MPSVASRFPRLTLHPGVAAGRSWCTLVLAAVCGCAAPTQTAAASELDIVFVIDSSGSISNARHAFAKQLVNRFVCGDAALDPSQTKFSIAVIQFATNAVVEIPLTLITSSEQADTVCEDIDAIVRINGDTDPFLSLNAAFNIFQNDSTAPERRLVFISDANVNNPGSSLEAARQMRNMNPPVRISAIEVHDTTPPFGPCIRDFMIELANSVLSATFDPQQIEGQYACIHTLDINEVLCADLLCDEDCNINLELDILDILSGDSEDCDFNAEPDECFDDCNANGIPDPCELQDGTAPDCNRNFIPDECDLAAGTSQDCNANGVPDECIYDPDEHDCDFNGVPDDCEGAPDCNANGIPDLCDVLFNGLDCNDNGIPDDCDIVSGGIPDCNQNGLPDSCDLADGTSLDCNANGIPGECENDCNGNGIEDECDLVGTETRSSGPLGPIGLSAPIGHLFSALPPPVENVTLTFTALADLIGSRKALDVHLDGAFIDRIFTTASADCGTPGLDQLIISRATFNTMIADGDLQVHVETLDLVDPLACGGSSQISIDLSYDAQILADTNRNGVPDSCDLADGDSNLDGVIDVLDLLALLNSWGPCDDPGDCPEDADGDGLVNVIDLLRILTNWNPA